MTVRPQTSSGPQTNTEISGPHKSEGEVGSEFTRVMRLNKICSAGLLQRMVQFVQFTNYYFNIW